MARRLPKIHERFLRHIWSKKYLKTQLFTTDGRRLEILNVGKFNTAAGPDFCNALIRLDGKQYRGDVEIHRTLNDWIQHQHQEDPRYNSVVLHVVLEDVSGDYLATTYSGRSVPTLVLSKYIPASLQTIWYKAILDERREKNTPFDCDATKKNLSNTAFEQRLKKLAQERLELKIRRFQERLHQLAFEHKHSLRDSNVLGQPHTDEDLKTVPSAYYSLTHHDFSDKSVWVQLLYEGCMEAFGYSQNREQFVKISRALPLLSLHRIINSCHISLEALLFGVAGLLPQNVTIIDEETREYLERLKNEWTRFASTYMGERLQSYEWQTFPTRPANFPMRRLAAAVGLTERFLSTDIFRSLITLFKKEMDIKVKKKELMELFEVPMPTYWQQRYDFFRRAPKKLPAIGNARMFELMVNILIPVCLLYARIFKDVSLRESVHGFYDSLPPREVNSIVRLMEKNVVQKRIIITTVSQQQALIQLYKYYCCEQRCKECLLLEE